MGFLMARRAEGDQAGPALIDWKNENRLQKSTTAHGGENK
jgi:hypothetical protein